MSELVIYEKLKDVLEEKAALKIAQAISEAVSFYEKMVTKDEFNELKGIVKELAEAQKRTEQRVEELAEAQKRTEQRVEELAEAQKRTEQRVEELAEAQKRTEQRVEELAEAQKKIEERLTKLEEKMIELAEAQKRTEQRVEELAEAQRKTEVAILELTKGLKNLRKDFGGFSLTMSYAFENEAFRHLPAVLKEKYNIKIKEKFIRQEVGGKEINVFAKGEKNGDEVFIIGESKLRLEEKEFHHIISELEEKEEAVREEYGEVKLVKILITHYAKKGFIKRAEEEGIIVVQSFEW